MDAKKAREDEIRKQQEDKKICKMAALEQSRRIDMMENGYAANPYFLHAEAKRLGEEKKHVRGKNGESRYRTQESENTQGSVFPISANRSLYDSDTYLSQDDFVYLPHNTTKNFPYTARLNALSHATNDISKTIKKPSKEVRTHNIH